MDTKYIDEVITAAGFVNGNINERQKKFLTSIGFPQQLNEAWYWALRSIGGTGALPDMFFQAKRGIININDLTGGPPTDYVALMDTLLSGTNGWVTDPADTSINFTDTAGTIPVSTPGVSTVARHNSKFGTTVYNWQNATGTQQYLWNGASLQADGIDDLNQTTNSSYTANMSAVTYTVRFMVDDLSVGRTLRGWGTGTATVVRMQPRINSDGSILLAVRRLDADAQNNFTSAAGLVTTGVEYTLQFTIDFAGTGNIEVFLDGVSVLTGTLAGSPGNSENTNSARDRRGLNNGNTLNDYWDGKLGCEVFYRGLADSTQLANMRGFVERNAL